MGPIAVVLRWAKQRCGIWLRGAPARPRPLGVGARRPPPQVLLLRRQDGRAEGGGRRAVEPVGCPRASSTIS
eukprot:6645633-Alexandrium_andersonii.AAC.1